MEIADPTAIAKPRTSVTFSLISLSPIDRLTDDRPARSIAQHRKWRPYYDCCVALVKSWA
jgi:hypothetical protein